MCGLPCCHGPLKKGRSFFFFRVCVYGAATEEIFAHIRSLMREMNGEIQCVGKISGFCLLPFSSFALVSLDMVGSSGGILECILKAAKAVNKTANWYFPLISNCDCLNVGKPQI